MAENPLGQQVEYVETYQPELLFPLPRSASRKTLGLSTKEVLPFQGVDIWNCYEVSWLDTRGKPMVSVLEIRVPCASPFMIESKSLKLYLNSLTGTRFTTSDEVLKTIETDLSTATDASVAVRVLEAPESTGFSESNALLLDDLEVDITTYSPDPTLLQYGDRVEDSTNLIRETVYSHLFKTNCPVTGQPDWATLFIAYHGRAIDHDSLLRYLISFRRHQGYHEQSVEQIFMDIAQRLKPLQLTVYARYTRRGGIDINPFRSSTIITPENRRTFRQ